MLWKEGFAVDSLCAERNAPSLVSATLPPHFTQATAPHARSWLYSTLSANRIVLRNPAALKATGPVIDAPRPPALFVDPFLSENRRKPWCLHRL